MLQKQYIKILEEMSHLPLLPLVEIHHCVAQLWDEVLTDKVDG